MGGWQAYEGAVAGALRDALGWRSAELTAAGADGGVDVRGVTRTGGPVVVQAKCLAQGRVGRPVVQRLAGVAAVEGAVGMVVTTVGYSSGAVAWADQAGVGLFVLPVGGTLTAANAVAATTLRARPARRRSARPGGPLGEPTVSGSTRLAGEGRPGADVGRKPRGLPGWGGVWTAVVAVMAVTLLLVFAGPAWAAANLRRGQRLVGGVTLALCLVMQVAIGSSSGPEPQPVWLLGLAGAAVGWWVPPSRWPSGTWRLPGR